MLRENIEQLFKQYADPTEAAIQVCIFLEDTIDLYGNGWFDDDETMEKRLEAYWNSDK